MRECIAGRVQPWVDGICHVQGMRAFRSIPEQKLRAKGCVSWTTDRWSGSEEVSQVASTLQSSEEKSELTISAFSEGGGGCKRLNLVRASHLHHVRSIETGGGHSGVATTHLSEHLIPEGIQRSFGSCMTPAWERARLLFRLWTGRHPLPTRSGGLGPLKRHTAACSPAQGRTFTKCY